MDECTGQWPINYKVFVRVGEKDNFKNHLPENHTLSFSFYPINFIADSLNSK
jgi:hypothetical protein